MDFNESQAPRAGAPRISDSCRFWRHRARKTLTVLGFGDAGVLGCELLVHYGHSCLIPIDRTSGIKMLYVFVDIKIDSLHFVETLKHNFLDKEDFPEQPRLALFR